MNPLRMLRVSSRFTLAAGLGTALNLPVSALAARRLGPELYGEASFVILWLTYLGLVRTGAFEGGQRELIHLLGKGDRESAHEVQNVAVTAELLWAVVPCGLLLGAAQCFPDALRRGGFRVAALMYVTASVSRMLTALELAHRRYELYAWLKLAGSLLQPLLLLGLLYPAGVYSLWLAPLGADGVVCGLALAWRPRLRLSCRWHWAAVGRLVRIGFPIGLHALVYWAYRFTGVATVAALLPAEQLGYYAFSAKMIDYALRPFADFSGVLTREVWAAIGRSGGVRGMEQPVARTALLVMAAAGAMANFGQAIFAPAVRLLVPRFSASIELFAVLAFNIVFLSAAAAPGLILDSAVVNRQWLHVGIWGAGLAVNAAANLVVIRLGWGMTAVAWNDVWVQLLVALALYAAAGRWLFATRREAARFAAMSALLMALALLLYLWFEQETAAWARLAAAAAVWGVVAASMRRGLRQTEERRCPALAGENL